MEGDILAAVKSLHLRGEGEIEELIHFQLYINTDYFRSL